jgi:hypothetical protein
MQHIIQSKNIWENSSGALGFSQRSWNCSLCRYVVPPELLLKAHIYWGDRPKEKYWSGLGRIGQPLARHSLQSQPISEEWVTSFDSVIWKSSSKEWLRICMNWSQDSGANGPEQSGRCKRSPIITSHKRIRQPSLSHLLERRMSFHIIDGSNRENGIIHICGG